MSEMKKARSVKERVGTVKSQWDLKQGLSARKRITMGTRGDFLDNSNQIFRKEVKSDLDWSRRNRDFDNRKKFKSITRRGGGGRGRCGSIPDDLVLTEITDQGPVKKEEYVGMETDDEEDNDDHRTSSRRRQW